MSLYTYWTNCKASTKEVILLARGATRKDVSLLIVGEMSKTNIVVDRISACVQQI